MEKEISKATLKRLPTYLAYLKSLPEGSSVNISATALAAGLHMGEVQVRKDLALVSSGGAHRGYRAVPRLRQHERRRAHRRGQAGPGPARLLGLRGIRPEYRRRL